MPMAGCPTSTGAPQLLQNWRWLFSVRLYMPSLSAPFTTFTLVAGQRLAAWIGAPSQLRQELQWQYTCAAGSPVISSCTAPQAQPLLYEFAMRVPPFVPHCSRLSEPTQGTEAAKPSRTLLQLVASTAPRRSGASRNRVRPPGEWRVAIKS